MLAPVFQGSACQLEIISAQSDEVYSKNFWIRFQKRFPVVATMFNNSSDSNKISSFHSTVLKPMLVKGELATSVKKLVKMKFVYLDDAGNDKLIHWLLLSLACCLMLTKRSCVYNAGLKVDAAQEILTVVMMSNDENVRSCKSPFLMNHLIMPLLTQKMELA